MDASSGTRWGDYRAPIPMPTPVLSGRSSNKKFSTRSDYNHANNSRRLGHGSLILEDMAQGRRRLAAQHETGLYRRRAARNKVEHVANYSL